MLQRALETILLFCSDIR